MTMIQYTQYGHSLNKVINYGQYQKQGPGKPKPPDDEYNLSEENKQLADYFSNLTLKFFKIEADSKELNKDTKEINKGLNYFI